MVYAVVLAGGSGTRMGNKGIPKQFLTIQDKPIIIHTLEKYIYLKEIVQLVIACHKQYCDFMKNLLIEYGMSEKIIVVEGGSTRMDSVLAGINEIKSNNDISDEDIFISIDSVRPIIKNDEVEALIKSAKKYGAATIVNKTIENIIKVNSNNEIEKIFKRENLYKDLSPQAFNINKFIECFNKLNDIEKNSITDLSEIFVNNGEKVLAIEGNTNNIKVTTPIDISIINELIKKL